MRRLEAPSTTGVSPFLQELQSVIAEHSHVMKSGIGDRAEYWKLRRDLSSRMAALLKSAEERWLGAARTLLLGSYVEAEANAALDELLSEALQLLREELSPARRAELRVILAAVHVLQPRELLSELRRVCRRESNSVLEKLSRLVNSRSLKVAGKRRHPVILILDPVLQPFPWESIPALCDAQQPVSRVPSLQFLR